MKLEKVLVVGGLLLVGYWIYKKTSKPKVIDVEPKLDTTKTDTKKPTIVLNLSGNPKKNVKDIYVRDFDTNTYSTIAKPQIEVEKI
jgi:hypothetical protein